jgi:hypothetical protein
MKISLITISSEGCIWRTLRDGQIVEGCIQPDVPREANGDYIYDASKLREGATSFGRPFSDLPVFFDATPKLEKFFAALTLREFSKKWLGIVLRKPTVAVHLVGYPRMIHLGEELALKACILRWGSNGAIICKWPTPYSDAQIREILLGEVFHKKPNQSLQPTAPSDRG